MQEMQFMQMLCLIFFHLSECYYITSNITEYSGIGFIL